MNYYLRFDSVGGASGDMILSALAALGADVAEIEKTIRGFFPEPLRFQAEPVADSGLNGLRVTVCAEHHHTHDEGVWPDAHTHSHVPASSAAHAHSHRGLAEIERFVSHAAISEASRSLALGVFRKLAEAEAKIHGKTPETVHFHEVGAWDSVADIVGSCLALEQLGVVGVSCGPLPSGVGTIRCAHGEMPNPAPATQELLAGMTVTQTDEPFELVTPTGAALLNVWTHALAPLPKEATVLRSAFGFGRRALNGRPNVLRATLLSEPCAINAPSASEEARVVLETNLDDCNPEWVGALINELLEHGATDVWCTPILMKKGRAGTLLSVLVKAADVESVCQRIFRSTTTFGIRFHTVGRKELARRFENVATPWGEVPVKIGPLRNGEDVTASPEHAACERLAKANHVAPKQVYEAAKAAWCNARQV